MSVVYVPAVVSPWRRLADAVQLAADGEGDPEDDDAIEAIIAVLVEDDEQADAESLYRQLETWGRG